MQPTGNSHDGWTVPAFELIAGFPGATLGKGNVDAITDLNATDAKLGR
jgi:hypothetical protein